MATTLPRFADDKRAHEMNIATVFVGHLLQYEGITATDLRPGDPKIGEPDNVCTIAGREHGIELVDCWESDAQAKVTWRAAREAHHLGKRGMIASSSDLPAIEAWLTHPSGNRLVAIAERRLVESIKAYGIPTWLILNASQTIAPLHHYREGAWLAQQIRKPAAFRYKAAYLLMAGPQYERRFFRVP